MRLATLFAISVNGARAALQAVLTGLLEASSARGALQAAQSVEVSCAAISLAAASAIN